MCARAWPLMLAEGTACAGFIGTFPSRGGEVLLRHPGSSCEGMLKREEVDKLSVFLL